MTTSRPSCRSDSTDRRPTPTIEDAVRKQYPIPGGWVCPSCKNYRGKLICAKNVLICFAGANMKGCYGYAALRGEEEKP